MRDNFIKPRPAYSSGLKTVRPPDCVTVLSVLYIVNCFDANDISETQDLGRLERRVG